MPAMARSARGADGDGLEFGGDRFSRGFAWEGLRDKRGDVFDVGEVVVGEGGCFARSKTTTMALRAALVAEVGGEFIEGLVDGGARTGEEVGGFAGGAVGGGGDCG